MPIRVNMVLPTGSVRTDQQSVWLLLARKPSWHSWSVTLPLSGLPRRHRFPVRNGTNGLLCETISSTGAHGYGWWGNRRDGGRTPTMNTWD